jgi:lipid A disaccharide synthetase
LFFAFWKREKLTATERVSSKRTRTESNEEWSQRNWNELCEGTYRAIVELARSRPDIRVVMKTKPQSVRVEQIIQMLGETATPLPENFIVLKGGDPIELIAESDAVIGFNSTALLEALACGKPVIVPDFAEAKDPAMTNLIIDLGAAVNKAGSPEEIKTLANRFLDAPAAPSDHLTQTAADTLSHWVGNDDGAASQRVLEAVRTEIERAKLLRASSPSFRAQQFAAHQQRA